MPKNKVQFQKGLSLIAFLTEYGKEEQCRDQFLKWRWAETSGQSDPLCCQ